MENICTSSEQISKKCISYYANQAICINQIFKRIPHMHLAFAKNVPTIFGFLVLQHAGINAFNKYFTNGKPL
jgi:hypothetical protein